MLLLYLGKGVSDRRLRFEERLVDQAVQSLPVVERLDLGEDYPKTPKPQNLYV